MATKENDRPLAAPPDAFPRVRAIVAEYRQLFGDVRLTYASEDGLDIGARGPAGVRPFLPPPKLKRKRA